MKRYFNTYYIKNGLFISFFLSLPIYLIHFGIDNKLLNSSSLILALILLYKNDIKVSPWIGFFTSIFWLWWISLSFRYYGLTYLIPFIIFGIGIFYFIIFYIISLLRYKIFILLFLIFGLKYITPFGFDWFRFDFILPKTYFYITKEKLTPPPLKIKTIQTYISQDKKWNPKYISMQINNNFNYIKESINSKYNVVILPESAFVLPLNLYPKILKELNTLSKQITIIVGGLNYKNKIYYNSTYLFQNGNYKIFNKHILVPFGEYIPFNCCKKFLNNIFFDGADDYIPAKTFSTYQIKGITFINAICYEATNEKLYKQKGKYIIAMSNNAWFYPSIEETLQKLIIDFYSNKYHKIVYHSINY